MKHTSTPKNLKSAIFNALIEMRMPARKARYFGNSIEDVACEILYKHIKNHASENCRVSTLRGETPIQLFKRIFGE